MPLNEDNELEYHNKINPKCPLCDFTIDIEKHALYELFNDGYNEIQCPNCKGTIIVQSHAKWSFSTDDQNP